MKKSPKKIAHIGIAVKQLNDTLPFYTTNLGLELEGIEEVHSEKVRVAFLKIGESRIELLESLDKTSAISQFIEKRGEGIHHIAFEVDDILSRIEYMKKSGIKMINEQPKQGANDSLVSFIHPKSTNGVLIELCEHDNRGES